MASQRGALASSRTAKQSGVWSRPSLSSVLLPYYPSLLDVADIADKHTVGPLFYFLFLIHCPLFRPSVPPSLFLFFFVGSFRGIVMFFCLFLTPCTLPQRSGEGRNNQGLVWSGSARLGSALIGGLLFVSIWEWIETNRSIDQSIVSIHITLRMFVLYCAVYYPSASLVSRCPQSQLHQKKMRIGMRIRY